MNTTSKDDARLETIVETVDEMFERDLMRLQQLMKFTPATRCPDVPGTLFFEKPEYLRVVGPRGPNYSKPYKLNNVSKQPTPENQASPFYREFSHSVKVIGYTAPLKIPTRVGSPQFVCRAAMASRTVMASFCAFDREWGSLKRTNKNIEAMRAVDRLFEPYNRQFWTTKLDLCGKLFSIHGLDTRNPTGVPFCFDESTRAVATCLDRIYELADELVESILVNKPGEVNAPPCTLAVTEIFGTKDTVIDIAYPAAVAAIEFQFLPKTQVFRQLFSGIDLTPMDLGSAIPSTYWIEIPQRVTESGRIGCTFRIEQLDESVNPDLIDFAMNVIYRWWDLDRCGHPPEMTLRLFRFLKHYMIHTPVLLPSGQLVRMDGSIPTGSCLSIAVKSIISIYVAVYCLQCQGISVDDMKGRLFVFGPDVAFSVPPGFLILGLLADAKSLGFEITPKNLRCSANSADLSFARC